MSATVGFPTSLHALNETLSTCIASKSLEPLHLGEVSFETFFKKLHPFLIRYDDRDDGKEVKLFKSQLLRLFPFSAENKKWYQIFNTIINSCTDKQAHQMPHAIMLELCSLSVNLPLQQRAENLIDQSIKQLGIKAVAQRIQEALCCLLIEDSFMTSTRAEMGLASVATGAQRLVQDQGMNDTRKLGLLVRHAANATLIRQTLQGLLKQESKFINQLQRARKNLDLAAKHLDCPALKSSDAVIQLIWNKFKAQQKLPVKIYDLYDSYKSIMNQVSPLGAWTFSLTRTMKLLKSDEMIEAYDDLRAVNARYLELRGKQAELYEFLFGTLRGLYDKQNPKREWLGFLKNPAQKNELLPQEMPSPSDREVFDVDGYLQTIQPPQKETSGSKPAIKSYTDLVAASLRLPGEIPQESDEFWKLACFALTTKVDRFVKLGLQATYVRMNNAPSDDIFFLAVEIGRDNGEKKRGILNFGIDRNKKCFHRQFVPMTDLQIIELLSSSTCTSESIGMLTTASLRRDGEVFVEEDHSAVYTLSEFSVILHDDRLGLTIEILPIRSPQLKLISTQKA